MAALPESRAAARPAAQMPRGTACTFRRQWVFGCALASCLSLAAASPAGDPSKRLEISGLGGEAYLAGDRIDVDGNTMTVFPQSGASVVSACNPQWRPEDITQFKLVGKTISFTVDLSRVGCACNLAFYLISAPAKDKKGHYVPGDNDLAPGNFYCDANKVGGQWCPEVDIMEANSHAFQSTPHKCDDPKKGHYARCDRGGCGMNTKAMARAFGPGKGFRIDTQRPFKVITAFTGRRGALSSMVTTLQQGENRVTLDHGNCHPEYYAKLSPAMVSGMSLRITYWGGKASTMSWMDKPPCGDQACHGNNSGFAEISDLEIGESTGASAGSHMIPLAPLSPVPSPAQHTTHPPSSWHPQPVTTWSPPTSPWSPPAVTTWKPPEPVMSFDCADGYTEWESWSKRKKGWCCANKGIACGKFDCFGHLEDWADSWSGEKKDWCCKRKAQGCPQSPGAPGPPATQQIGPLRWSNYPMKCFTDTGGSIGDLIITDCDGPNGNSKQIWQSIGDGTIRLAAEPRRCMDIADSGTVQNGGRVQVAQCRENDLGQQFSINTATMKIQWKAHRSMCLDITDHKTDNGTPLQIWRCIRMDTDQVIAWPVIPLAAPPSTRPPIASTRSPWEPTLPAPPTLVPPPSLTTLAPMSWPGWDGKLPEPAETTTLVETTVTYTTTTVPDPFDCNEPGLTRTTYKQRVWCCRFKHIGCPVQIPPLWRYAPPVNYPIHTRVSPEIDGPRTQHLLHPGDAFRVTEGREGYDGVLYLKLEGDMGWTFESKPGIGTMCVENLQVVDTTKAPYDCEADLGKWQAAWSTSKKAWCCSNHQRGCGPAGGAAQPSSAPFDCVRNFEKWRSTWTVSQAAFCCNTVRRGCADESSGSFDCTLWFPGYEKTWHDDQRLWCCRHRHRGCPQASNEDCHAGSVLSWRKEKRLWCCAYRGVACPERAKAHLTRQFSSFGKALLGLRRQHALVLCAAAFAVTAGSVMGLLARRRCHERERELQCVEVAEAGRPPRSPLADVEVSLLRAALPELE